MYLFCVMQLFPFLSLFHGCNSCKMFKRTSYFYFQLWTTNRVKHEWSVIIYLSNYFTGAISVSLLLPSEISTDLWLLELITPPNRPYTYQFNFNTKAICVRKFICSAKCHISYEIRLASSLILSWQAFIEVCNNSSGKFLRWR